MDSKPAVWPQLGCGVGLRPKHYPVITTDWPKVDWFEAITENYMDSGGRPVLILEQIRARYPIALHGVALSIGSMDPLNENYLTRLKNLVSRIQPAIVSDHLCWSGAGGEHLHDLLPLPFTEEAIQHVVSRVQTVQELLKRPILLENVSAYVTFQYAEMQEWTFLSEIARRSGCGILLDLNNIYVNARNHELDAKAYVEAVPVSKVGQFHLAGHTDMGKYLFDTHSAPVIEPVWELYRRALKRFGQVSTLIEWDESIPDWVELEAECGRARDIYARFENAKPAADLTPPASLNSAIESSGKSLREIQLMIKSYIQPAAKKPTELIFNPQGGDPGAERMDVYAGGYTARVHESLGEVYETVLKVLGDHEFYHLAEAYAKQYPSHDYNLTHAGRDLPKMLVTYPAAASKYPFLPELARFEWMVSETFHAFDKEPFDRGQLAKIAPEDWENLKITFQPSIQLFQSDWPIMSLWEKRRQGSIEKSITQSPQKILVGRRGAEVRCEILRDDQYELIRGLLAGQTLGLICEKLAEKTGDEELPIAEWFSGWVQDGLISGCAVSAEASGV